MTADEARPPVVDDPRHTRLWLAAILLLGLALRVWGLGWGLPRVDLSPDELNVLQVTERISWTSPDPGFYNYSGLTFHLNFLAAELARAVGIDVGPPQQLLIDRLWSVLWGTATILVVYLIGRALWGRPRPALLGAAMLAIMPLHVTDSHFGVTDIGLTFWCALAFLVAVVAYRAPSLSAFLVGGLTVGFAIGTKFNGAVVGAAFIVTAALIAWERQVPALRAFAWLCAAGTASLVGFFASSPYSILNARKTVAAFLYESSHVHGGHFGFDVSAPGWQYHRGLYQLVAAFPFSFGVALYLLVLAGLVWFIARASTAERWMLLGFPALYLGVTATWVFVPIRYYLPVAAMLLLATAWSVDRALDRWPVVTHVVVGLVGVYTLVFGATLVARFSSDTRIEAAEWAATTLPANARVWYGEPVFGASYMPRFSSRPDIEVGSAPLDRLASLRGPMRHSPGRGYLVLSSLTYLRTYRQGDAEGIALYDAVRDEPRRFERLATFDDWYLNKGLYEWLDPMFGGYFVSPRIEVYRVPRRPPRRRRPAPAAEPEGGAESRQ